MNSEEMENLIRGAVNDADLRPENIPSIDLYLDQILSLVSDKVQEGSPRFHDRILTNTMINNYSKDGLISAIKGKKYSKEQFIQILLVYGLKNTLSIGEIRRVLQNIYSMPDYSERALLDCYGHFLDIKEYERENAWPLIKLYIDEIGLNVEEERDFFVMILGLASMSSYLKNAVQALLEAHYPDLNEEKERKERERQEELKRLKEEKKKTEKAKKEAAKATPSKDAPEAEG